MSEYDAQKDLSEQIEKSRNNFIEDMKFAMDNYDEENRCFHSKSESWDLASHMLNDLEFNIVKIQDFHSVPSEYVFKAEDLVGKDATRDEKYNAAKQMWNEQLDVLLHHVWLYRFYSDYGDISFYPDISADKKEFLEKHKCDIPYNEKDDIDFDKLNEMVEEEWKAIWKIVTEIGQSLWT